MRESRRTTGARGRRWRSRPAFRAAAAAPLTVGLLGLAACGGEDKVPDPGLPSETPALWNPCDALDTAFVRRTFGSRTTENSGTATQPDCRFAPEKKSGQAVVTVNYQLFDGDLDELWQSMGQDDRTDVRDPRIAGADGARIVTDVVDGQLYATGFVQTGTLFQVVNVVDPAPFERDGVVAGVSSTLTVLADHANEAGIGASPSTSPSTD